MKRTEFGIALRYILRANTSDRIIRLMSLWPRLTDAEQFDQANQVGGARHYNAVIKLMGLCFEV